MAQALTPAGTVQFHQHTVPYYHQKGQTLLAGADLGRLLGFARPRQSMNWLWKRNEDELSLHATDVSLTSVDGKVRKSRAFTETGAYLVTMFAATPVAKEVRLWLAQLPRFVRERTAPAEQLARKTTAKERNPLAVLVNQYLGRLGPSRSNYANFWTKTFHPVFGVGAVDDLTIDQLPRAIAFMQALLARPTTDTDTAQVDAAIRENFERWAPFRETLQNDLWKIGGELERIRRDFQKVAGDVEPSNALQDDNLAQQATLAFRNRIEEVKAGVEALYPLAMVTYSALANAMELKKNRQTLWGIKRALPQ